MTVLGRCPGSPSWVQRFNFADVIVVCTEVPARPVEKFSTDPACINDIQDVVVSLDPPGRSRA